MQKPIVIGAVIHEPKVAVIWGLIKEFFDAHDCPIDYVLFSNYERQVTGLLQGYIDIAWNSSLALLDVQRCTRGRCRVLAMRDTDCDRVTHIVVARGSGLVRIEDLRGKVVAVGAKDSPQATLIPLQLLHGAGLWASRDIKVRQCDVLVGVHGEHVGGELEAFECLKRHEADAACVLDINWARWLVDGTADSARFAVLATTPKFDCCNFTILDHFPLKQAGQWSDVLFRMNYDDPANRSMMDLHGLKTWMLGRSTGFRLLADATRDQKFWDGEAA